VKGVKQGDEFRIKLEGVCLNEGKRIVRLGLIINADYFKASHAIAYTCAAGATEKVEQPRFSWFRPAIANVERAGSIE
jgi:hypothetical protein